MGTTIVEDAIVVPAIGDSIAKAAAEDPVAKTAAEEAVVETPVDTAGVEVARRADAIPFTAADKAPAALSASS